MLVAGGARPIRAPDWLGADRGRVCPLAALPQRGRFALQCAAYEVSTRGFLHARLLVDLARWLSEAIWHMLTTDKPFAPAGAAESLAS